MFSSGLRILEMVGDVYQGPILLSASKFTLKFTMQDKNT